MKIIACEGSPQRLGEQTGEALREEIREHISLRPMRDWPEWERRAPLFLDTLKTHLPHVLEEMLATARAADVPEREILRLNLPLYPHRLTALSGVAPSAAATDEAPAAAASEPGEGCTNFVFTGGADGPVWGKNNDGSPPPLPVCARVVRPDRGIPQVTFTFCGMVATTDGMNAEGVAVGHSSVGSVFQQSDRHLPIRLWAYDVMMNSGTTEDFLRLTASVPLRGKGYSIVCVDRGGTACSLEAPCPVLQVRTPRFSTGIHCVNCYQLPELGDADRRNAEGKRDAQRRWEFLDAVLSESVLSEKEGFSLASAQSLLRYHHSPDRPGICRHGESGGMHTEYTMIGLPAHSVVLFLEGRPCQREFTELTL